MTDDFKTILLAFDGTERGRMALRAALPLLGRDNARVYLLAVVPVTGALAAAEGFFSEDMYAAEHKRVQAVLDEGLRILADHGVDAEGLIQCGQPARKIAAVAQELEADLVVVGHQHRGPLARWWQGSVGASLIDLLDCALLVVQASDDAKSP